MIFLLASAVLGSAPWPTYTNVRYGYAVCYPANILRKQPEADAGDGRKFISPDGAELSVFAQWNVDDRSLADWAMEQAKTFTGKQGDVSYRAGRGNWLVLSGKDRNASEFYTKTFKRDDEFVTMQITYPAKRARFYRPLVERLSRCLRLTTLSS